MGILFALLPAITWGSLVLLSVKLKGSPYQQALGTTIGALLFSIIIFFFRRPDLTSIVWSVSIVSGILWTIGQMNQYASVRHLGVSMAVPMSTGMQLFCTTLIGVLVFREWTTLTVILIGSLAIVCIIAGVVFTSIGQKAQNGQEKSVKKGIVILMISTVGYVGYVVLIRWFNIDGWSAVFPQSIGMVMAAIALTARHQPISKYTLRNMISGLWWAIGNLGLLLAIPLIGVAVSFSMAQTGIVLSTLGGIYLLKEKVSKKSFVIIGCLLIIAGGVLLGITK